MVWTMLLTLDQVAQRLAACPANAWLGLVPVAVDETGVTLAIPVRPEMGGNPKTGAMHGGMIAALVDTVCSFAWLTRNHGYVSTIDLRVDYHRPVMKDKLIGVGRIVRAGRRIVTADAEIADSDGNLLVTGRAVMMPFPEQSNPV